MFFPEYTWILLIVSAVICLVGFYKYVYFLSVGYGLSVAGLGVAMAVLYVLTGGNAGNPDPNSYYSIPVLIQCVLCVVYGIRLGGFLLVREIKSAAYRKTLNSQTDKPMPFFVKVALWLCCAALYVMQVSPIWYRISNLRSSETLAWVGCLVMLIGILLEGIADKQKSAAKEKNPDMPAMDGLFKMCRCPNYFGEVVFWTGIFISGLNIMTGWQWLVAAFGYVCIVYIMFNGAKRLEKRHIKNYGSKPEYIAYADHTPILISLLPIYHMVKKEEREVKRV